mgnify:CR=1 FL=1
MLEAVLEEVPLTSRVGWEHERFRWITWPTLLAVPFAYWQPAATGLLLISLYKWARLHWKWPNENRWLERAQELFAAGSFDEALAHLSKPPLGCGYTTLVQAEFARVRSYLANGQQHKAQECLRGVDTTPLLPAEQDEFETLFTNFYWLAGNIRSARRLLGNWNENQILKDHRRVLIVSEILQEQGHFEEAREYLQRSIDRTQDPDSLWRIYNNLANLEGVQDRKTDQLDHLEAAWHHWCQKPAPLGISQIAHNLAIQHVQAGNVERAHEVTGEVFQQIDSGHPKQMLAWYNLGVEVAREAGDRNRLVHLHADFENRADQLNLKTPERITLAVTGLRMWLNDGVPLSADALMERIEGLLGEFDQLTVTDQIPALAEIAHVVQQVWERRLGLSAGAPKLAPLLDRCEVMFVDRGPMIDAHLHTLPPSLVFERKRWRKLRNDSYKIRIRRSEGYPDQALNGLFNNLRESAELCEKREATVQAMHDWVSLCDEYLAYQGQLPKAWAEQLEQDYREAAEHALDKAEALLEARAHPYGVEDIMLGLADFALQLHDDTGRARYWLQRFEDSGASIWRYAEWLRVRYAGIKNRVKC